MGWKFWKTKGSAPQSNGLLPKPKEIPEPIGRHLVVQKKMDPDFVWALKCALKPLATSQTEFDFRLYDPVAARDAGVAVTNFNALDTHPELVLFSGRYDRRSRQFDMADTAMSDQRNKGAAVTAPAA